MGYTSKPLEELDVMDDFLFSAIAADREVGEVFCKKLLSVLLGRKIGKIRVTAQHTLPAPAPEYRGIRMDVEVEEYEEGENDFSRLPDLFVITILNYDPFGCGYMMYTVENHCIEVPDLKYGDGLKFLYFYTGGTKGGSEEIGNMLRYLQHSTAENAMDTSTKELHDYVSRVKIIPEVRQGYMSLSERFFYERQEGIKEGARENAVENILELLEDYGEIPEGLKERLNSIEDMTLLKKYHKLAARVGSITEFQNILAE